MQLWSRDPTTSKLIRSSSPPKPEPRPDVVIALLTSLQEMYPMRTSLPSYIWLLETNGNSFELKPQFINALLNFHGLESEDAYFFIREFEKVCLMMSIYQLGDDVVRLHFVPFAFKDLVYSLAVYSITSWDNFVKLFLKKFYPIHKNTLIRKNIM